MLANPGLLRVTQHHLATQCPLAFMLVLAHFAYRLTQNAASLQHSYRPSRQTFWIQHATTTALPL